MATAVTFTNYSSEDFTHTWDSVKYPFPAGKSTMLESGLALHFAKHLAVRELNKRKVESLGANVIEKEMKKALDVGDTIEAEDTTKLAQDTANYNSMKKGDLVKEAEDKGIEVAGKNKAALVSDLEGFEGK